MTTDPSHILFDPVDELERALKSHAFGIDPASSVLLDRSFPVTAEDRAAVAAESRETGSTSSRATARAKIVFAAGEGEGEVVLDGRGYTLESVRTPQGMRYPNETYESLDALLIAVSPAYVQAMGAELSARFAGVERGDGSDAPPVPDEGWGDVPSQGLGDAGKGFT